MGSTCIYPREAPQPVPEEALLTGPLEPTNEWYAMAKIAGIKPCKAFWRNNGCDLIAAQPTNLYGPGDNYDFETSQLLPALLSKRTRQNWPTPRHDRLGLERTVARVLRCRQPRRGALNLANSLGKMKSDVTSVELAILHLSILVYDVAENLEEPI